MKLILFLLITLLWSIASNPKENSISTINSNFSELIGTWEVDFSPQDTTDDWITILTITNINSKEIDGFFYNSKTKEGRVATQNNTIHFAFVTKDGRANYNTSGRFENGILYGSTHSIGRDFLAPWTAKKLIN